MFAENDKISLRQLECMLLLYFFGTAALFLPSELAQTSGQACWFSVIVWGIVAVLLCLLLTEQGRRHPAYTAAEWYCYAFGSVPGRLLAAVLGLSLVFLGAMELRIFCEVVSATMLPQTPLWLVNTVVLLLCGICAAHGLECTARAAEILFLVVFLPLLLVLLAVIISADYGRLLPLALPDLPALWHSGRFFSPVLQGLFILLFVFPYLQSGKRVRRHVCWVCLLGGGTLTVIVLLSLTAFGGAGLAGKALPTLEMLERVSFSGVFLSRQDLLLLWFWMGTVFLFVSAALLFGADLSGRIFGTRREKNTHWLLLWLVLLLCGALLPQDLAQAHWLRQQAAPWLGGIFLLLLPLALLCIDNQKRRQGNE